MSAEATPPHDHNLRMRFLAAAEIGAVDIARDILYQGALNPETLDRALGLAAGEGQVDFIRFLIDEIRMDISHAGPDVLAQAVRDRETAVVELLTLDGRLRLTPETPLDHHYLDLALVGSSPYSGALLQLLLDRGAEPVAAGFDSVNTALRAGNSDALKRFMQKSPAIRHMLGSKLTSAAMRLDHDGVRALLQNGASADYHECAPMRGLIQQMTDMPRRDKDRIFTCARLLLRANGSSAEVDRDLLKAAIQVGNTVLIREMLERGTDVEPEMRGIGYNKMVLAAAHGFDDLVERFHRQGKMPLHAYEEAVSVAAEKGNAALVDKMLNLGVDLSLIDLVFCAAVGGQVGLVKDLEARGYTTDFKDATLLEAVIAGDHGPMLDYLLDQGADRAKAQEFYTCMSSRRSKPYDDVRKTLENWSARAETVACPVLEPASFEALRATGPDWQGGSSTLLLRLAKANRISEAVKLAMATQNGRLEGSDLLAADSAGNSVIEILGARGQLAQVFPSALWEKQQQEFAAIYAEVAPVYRDQIDANGLVATWRREALAREKARIPKLKGP